jgi:hypothetical protein
MVSIMKRNVLIGIFLSGSSLSIFAQSSDIQKPITITPHITIQNFDWLERSTAAQIGVQIQLKPTKKLNVTVDGNVFKSIGNATNIYENPSLIELADNNSKITTTPTYGSSGQHGSGSSTEIKKSYQGAFINIDAGIPIKLGDSSRTIIEPFVSIEGKIWSRSADYGTDGNPLIYEEKYKFLSPALGAKLSYNTKSKVKLSLRISASYPAISKLKTDSKSLTNPNVEIDLAKWLSPSVELGVKVKKVTLKLRYERINIGTPDSIRGCSPASRTDVTGLSVGYDF